ncbi:hypothetical protein DXG01_000273 [Tephrocybe rancida]|nr:hypothetical protein DXG01_000273 [Tephrocybe rancida]
MSRRSHRSNRYTQPSLTATSEAIPHVPPISTVIANSTYRPAGQPLSNETLHVNPQHHQRSDPQQKSRDGPQVVIITPPPPSLNAQLPNNSRTSLDTAGSVSTPLKGFRVVNPDPDDPEQPASRKHFIYNPPPLPNVDTGALFSSRLLPVANHGVAEAYPPSLRNRAPPMSSPSPSRRHVVSRYSSRRQTQASQTFSDYAESDNNDDEIWAKRPTDLSNKGDHEEWLRPAPAAVYENLQDFFPEYDLNKAVVPITSANTLSKERGQDRKKSIRVVAENRAQSGPRRRTKLWDSKVEELHM